MKILYFDCFAGASGNMILGALVALGVDENALVEELKKLDISDFDIEFTTKDKSGIAAIHADVKVPHEHAHRHLHHIEKIINDSRLADSVKTRAIEIFTRLAEAEAKVHGIDVKKVHFHEVGAMDAIVDVVGACIGFEMLGIEKFLCSKIHTGSGFVKMAHGKFPIPPPAVAEIFQTVKAPLYQTEIEGELITPTGAAIIATVCASFGAMPEMNIVKTAYGAGTREYKDFPNVLRLILGESESPSSAVRRLPFANQGLQTQFLVLIETNLDDISSEILGFVMEKAFIIGALDCWFTPIQMKKNRPAVMLSILCGEDKKDILTDLIFSETTTLGVRLSKIERKSLPRETVQIETEAGKVDVKVAKYCDKVVNIKPEYDQIREIALKSDKSFRQTEREILDKLK